MNRNTSFTEGLARSIGYLLGTLFSPKSDAQGRKIVPANLEAVKTVQKTEAIDVDTLSASMAHLDPIGTRMAQYRPALTRNVPLEGGLGMITLRIHEVEKRVEFKVEIHSARLRKAVGLNSQVFEPFFYEAVDLSGMSVTDFAVAKSVHAVQGFLNKKIAESAAVTGKAGKVKVKEQGTPAAAAPRPESAEPQSSGEAEPVMVRAQSAKEKLQFVGAGTGTRTSKDRKTKEVTQYEQFYIDILDVALGKNLNRIWGTDLERAMEAAGVIKGDLIQVTNLGRIPIELGNGAKEKGRNAFKNSYDIKKL